MRNLQNSLKLLEESRKYLAGGVASGVQNAFSPHALFMDYGEGSHIFDVDGNQYVDYVLGFRPLILGHAPKILTDAVSDQLRRGTVFGSPSKDLVELSRILCELLPSGCA